MDASYIAIIITIITIILFIFNRLPMSVITMFGALAMGVLIPNIVLSAVFSGFSSPVWIMEVGILVVSDALLDTGVAERIGQKIGISYCEIPARRCMVKVA